MPCGSSALCMYLLQQICTCVSHEISHPNRTSITAHEPTMTNQATQSVTLLQLDTTCKCTGKTCHAHATTMRMSGARVPPSNAHARQAPGPKTILH